MSTGRDSRYNGIAHIAIIGPLGEQVENVRLDLPYPRPAVTLKAHTDVTRYPVRGDDTWRSLGIRFMQGQAHLWWAIAEFTGVIDPFTELQPGKTVPGANGTVTIPAFDLVMFDLLSPS